MQQADLPLPMPRATMRAHLLLVLSRDHKGRGQGIKARDLAHKLQIEERTLRSLVTEMRSDGEAVVATPETGYYIAQAPDEIEQCCRFLRARALKSLQLESRLRNIPLPELLGQLRLNQA
jgi:hypothetical protein